MKSASKLKQSHCPMKSGSKKAAQQLGIPYYLLADWRHRQNIMGEDHPFVGNGHVFGFMTASMHG